jgi:hypothetical protein
VELGVGEGGWCVDEMRQQRVKRGGSERGQAETGGRAGRTSSLGSIGAGDGEARGLQRGHRLRAMSKCVDLTDTATGRAGPRAEGRGDGWLGRFREWVRERSGAWAWRPRPGAYSCGPFFIAPASACEFRFPPPSPDLPKLHTQLCPVPRPHLGSPCANLPTPPIRNPPATHGDRQCHQG